MTTNEPGLSATDRRRYSHVGHTGISIWNPLSEQTLERALTACGFGRGARVLDVGCGRGEVLARAAEQLGVSGIGVELDSDAAALASVRTDALPGIEIRAEPFDGRAFAAGSFDGLLSMGALHAAGGREPALKTFRGLLRPGGVLLLADGVWDAPPSPDYVEFLGGDEHFILPPEALEALLESAGFVVEHAFPSTLADWDAYEIGYSANLERYCDAHPEDPARDEFLRRTREWLRGYLRWGRGTIGYTLLVLRAGTGLAPDAAGA